MLFFFFGDLIKEDACKRFLDADCTDVDLADIVFLLAFQP